MLDFIHLSAMGVAEIADSINQKGCPHTFGHVVDNRYEQGNLAQEVAIQIWSVMSVLDRHHHSDSINPSSQ